MNRELALAAASMRDVNLFALITGQVTRKIDWMKITGAFRNTRKVSRNLAGPTNLPGLAKNGHQDHSVKTTIKYINIKTYTAFHQLQSNLYITVILGKWPGDRYIQGDRCTQVSFKLPWK